MAFTTVNDLIKGVDFSVLASASGSQHNQLVELAVPATGSNGDGAGMILLSHDTAANTPVVPDATTTTKWKTYKWIRIPYNTESDQTPIEYAWNDNVTSDATLLKWVRTNDLSTVEADITTVTTLANTAISTANTALTTANDALNATVGVAGGVLTGNYPNPNLVNGGVVTAALADESVTNSKLSGSGSGTPCVDPLKNINVTGLTALSIPRVNAGVTALEFVPKLITQLAEPVAGNALQVPRIKSDASGYEFKNPGILQIASAKDNTVDSTNTVECSGSTTPTQANTKDIPGLTLNVIPVSQSSNFYIRLAINLGNQSTSGTIVAIFATINSVVTLLNTALVPVTANYTTPVILETKVSSALLTKLQVGYAPVTRGGGTNSGFYNTYDGINGVMNGKAYSTIVAQEIL